MVVEQCANVSRLGAGGVEAVALQAVVAAAGAVLTHREGAPLCQAVGHLQWRPPAGRGMATGRGGPPPVLGAPGRRCPAGGGMGAGTAC